MPNGGPEPTPVGDERNRKPGDKDFVRALHDPSAVSKGDWENLFKAASTVCEVWELYPAMLDSAVKKLKEALKKMC